MCHSFQGARIAMTTSTEQRGPATCSRPVSPKGADGTWPLPNDALRRTSPSRYGGCWLRPPQTSRWSDCCWTAYTPTTWHPSMIPFHWWREDATPEAGVSPHYQSWELAENGGDRVQHILRQWLQAASPQRGILPLGGPRPRNWSGTRLKTALNGSSLPKPQEVNCVAFIPAFAKWLRYRTPCASNLSGRISKRTSTGTIG